MLPAPLVQIQTNCPLNITGCIMKKSIRITLNEKLKRWLNACREEKFDHYSCYLPGRIGFLSSFILKQFFSGIKLDEDQTDVIKKVPKDGIIVYATKPKSHFEYLFYHTRY